VGVFDLVVRGKRGEKRKNEKREESPTWLYVPQCKKGGRKELIIQRGEKGGEGT